MRALNGWWRIWIIITLALLTHGTVAGFNQRQSGDELSSKNVCVPGTIETEMVSQPAMDTWSAYKNTPPEMLARDEIIDPRVEVERFSCVSWLSILEGWAAAFAAAFALLAVVYVARWIGAGFNRSKD